MKIIGIKQLNKEIEKCIDKIPKNITVNGRVIKYDNSNGHIYGTLEDIEDKNNVLSICIWRSSCMMTKKESIVVGDIIQVTGTIKSFMKRSCYSMHVNNLKLEKTCISEFDIKYKKYEKKGYFDLKNKKVIDFNNVNKIALLTSITSEAYVDFFKNLQGRYCRSTIYPINVCVQGDRCADSIISAIDKLERVKFKDVILITRGGGSKMDLDCFNDERLVERIWKCKIPVVCAIGHERDNSICDFVADKRTSTPTSLAHLVSKDKMFLKNILTNKLSKYGSDFIDIYTKNLEKINEIKNDLKFYIGKNTNFNTFKIGNNIIKNSSDFRAMLEETITIELDDCVITYKIGKHNIKKRKKNKYNKEKYQDVINSSKPSQGCEDLYEDYNKLLSIKFETKENYILFKKIYNHILFHENELKRIYKIEEQSDEKIKLQDIVRIKRDIDDNLTNLDFLLKYKLYINYINKLTDIEEDDTINIEGKKIRKYDRIFRDELDNNPNINEMINIYKNLISFNTEINKKYLQ
jgi:exodeoxyribonuclease VII large subunit